MFLPEIDLASSRFPRSSHKYLMMIRRQRNARKGKALKILPGGLMAPCTFSVKFSYDTQFIFKSMMFTAGEDGNLELLAQGPAPSHPRPLYGKASYYPTYPLTLSASDNVCSDLNPHEESYYLAAMTSLGCPIWTPIFQPSVGTLSSSVPHRPRATRGRAPVMSHP
jgi:hypothetical protein